MSNEKRNKVAEAIGRVPNERIEDLFSDAIRAKTNEPDCKLAIQEFDVTIRKELDQSNVFVDMTVYGMAGDTTKDEFVQVDADGMATEVVKGGGSVMFVLDDGTSVKFVFSGITNLNATDYMVSYKLA